MKYDYMPKYCKRCKLQGHNENKCYVIHPKLYPKQEKEADKEEVMTEDINKNKDNPAVTTEDKKATEKEFQVQRGGQGRAN